MASSATAQSIRARARASYLIGLVLSVATSFTVSSTAGSIQAMPSA
jgi:hypothetical protein